ncbi:hypothetical protein PAE9249_01709 [Paenibacillus sp. CECT 9249]|uniref:hypothetical protein n=1 Tax=Paenibacillus sp. CECT 9249 TaxID=2845385 RepID=UPI001E353E0C|nr:hypothetical protein [Paenibacillus sp. CECT 9249]CAH0119210.1 hypothetical protein PAE9249_01709 [Paenibacillus sp. CECT 9249]
MALRGTVTFEQRQALHAGLVIPAHPLALDKRRKLDERRQRALTRYSSDFICSLPSVSPAVFRAFTRCCEDKGYLREHGA